MKHRKLQKSGIDKYFDFVDKKQIIFFIIILHTFFTAFSAWYVDAVYLLDVTSSMVGCDAPDIMNKVLDRLIFDIDNFDRGRIILITFANGPYDLDGPGPIKSQYIFHINSEDDKLPIKQFLRPDTYGPFPQAPTWPGIYQKVLAESTRGGKLCAGGIGPTGIYTTILHALDILELFQKEGGNDYTSTHIQEIVVYTDGRNNAPGSPPFEDVVQALKKRNFAMLGKFFYRRYLFSADLDDKKAFETELTQIRKMGADYFATNIAVTEISNLVTIYFDRRILTSYENLWDYKITDTKTVTVRNIHVSFFPPVNLDLLSGWRLIINPVSSKDFGLPDDVGIIVKTHPSEVILPVSTFDLLITITSYRKCVEFIEKNEMRGISGTISFALVPPRNVDSILLTLDLRHRVLLVNLPYDRPKLWIESEICDNNAVELNIKVDQVFLQLPDRFRTLSVNVSPADLLAQVITEKSEPIDIQQGIKIERAEQKIKLLFDTLKTSYTYESLKLKISISPELPFFIINGKTQNNIILAFRLAMLSIFPTKVTTENIWSPQKWCGLDTAPAEIPVELFIRSPFAGTLRLRAHAVDGLPADIKLKEASVNVPYGESRVKLNLLISPLQSWHTLYQSLGDFNEHVVLYASFNPDVPSTVVFSPTVFITFACTPNYATIYFSSLTKNPKLGEPVYNVSIKAEGASFPTFYLLVDGPTVLKIRDKQKEIYIEASPIAHLTPGEYQLILFKGVPGEEQTGVIKIVTSQDMPLLINVDNIEYRFLSGSFTLPYKLYIIPVEVKISCVCAQPHGRWRRGQSILTCSPLVTGIFEPQSREITFVIGNVDNLLIKTSSAVYLPTSFLPFEPFEIIIDKDAPGGRKVSTQVNNMRVFADISPFGLQIEAKIEKPFTSGYLFPKSYETLFKPILNGMIYFIWGSIVLVVLGLTFYSILYEKINPIEFFINYVWYNQKIRKYTVVWLMLGITLSIVGLILDNLWEIIV